MCTKVGLLVLRDSDLWPEVHRWAKDTFGPCAAEIMVVVIHILTGQADEFGDDMGDQMDEASRRERESSRMQGLILRREITLFRTQSDVLATIAMLVQYTCEHGFKFYSFSRDLDASERVERISQFAIILVGQLVGLAISQQVITWKEERDRKKQGAGLPEGKTYHVFLSHKKERQHSESLAVALKDLLEVKGYQSFFDKDNLDQISQEVLDRSIRESCCLLVVLDDVTLNSEWCRAEIKTAHAAGIPIRCLVDCDKYITGELCKQWFSSEHADVAALIFANQIVEWKTAFRQHTIGRLTAIMDKIVDSMWKEELESLKPQAGTTASDEESVKSLSVVKHPSKSKSYSTVTMGEQINNHLNQSQGLFEALQQKENVFWFTLAFACLTITQSSFWLSRM